MRSCHYIRWVAAPCIGARGEVYCAWQKLFIFEFRLLDHRIMFLLLCVVPAPVSSYYIPPYFLNLTDQLDDLYKVSDPCGSVKLETFKVEYPVCLSVSCDGAWTGSRCEKRSESLNDLFGTSVYRRTVLRARYASLADVGPSVVRPVVTSRQLSKIDP